jgi:signal transduction histidine kinase
MTRPTQSTTILIVDDNEQNRALAQAALDDEGYATVLAANGAEALRAFEESPPDCVLLDVRMPGLDGFAVCARMRALPRGQATPIIFLTAHRDVETFDRALEAGADDFLTKPVRPVELVKRVASVLELRRMSDELREHVEIVRQQRDALMRLQLQKAQLSAFVVHDLKSPVSAMDLLAQVLMREPGLSPRARTCAQRIRDEAQTLSRMVLNLLDISREEEGALRVCAQPVDLHGLVGEVFAGYGERSRVSEVLLEQRIGAPSAHADPDLLRRVIENLVENAMRHAPAGTRVTVESATSEGGVLLRVIDQGPGIAPDMRERVFDRYVQVDHGMRVVERTSRGLGLTFCKVAIEAHGGAIWIDDSAAGAVFVVRLPHGA